MPHLVVFTYISKLAMVLPHTNLNVLNFVRDLSISCFMRISYLHFRRFLGGNYYTSRILISYVVGEALAYRQ